MTTLHDYARELSYYRASQNNKNIGIPAFNEGFIVEMFHTFFEFFQQPLTQDLAFLYPFLDHLREQEQEIFPLLADLLSPKLNKYSTFSVSSGNIIINEFFHAAAIFQLGKYQPKKKEQSLFIFAAKELTPFRLLPSAENGLKNSLNYLLVTSKYIWANRIHWYVFTPLDSILLYDVVARWVTSKGFGYSNSKSETPHYVPPSIANTEGIYFGSSQETSEWLHVQILNDFRHKQHVALTGQLPTTNGGCSLSWNH